DKVFFTKGRFYKFNRGYRPSEIFVCVQIKI
ncbi:MAG: hypothetical protein ACI88H_000766, partial [Cocleimonas sp.]